jgi:DNA-binding transcriptional ArsR family regulator
MSDDLPQTFMLDSPEQLKAISDPFRQQLIGAFVQPATAKDAAKRLEVPVGRLYHHLDQLEAAGLIKVVAERRRRGAVERTFQAVARRFAVSADALGGGDHGQARESIARVALDELLAAYPPQGAEELHVARTRVNLTPAALARFELHLETILKEFASEDGIPTDILLFAAPRGD